MSTVNAEGARPESAAASAARGFDALASQLEQLRSTLDLRAAPGPAPVVTLDQVTEDFDVVLDATLDVTPDVEPSPSPKLRAATAATATTATSMRSRRGLGLDLVLLAGAWAGLIVLVVRALAQG